MPLATEISSFAVSEQDRITDRLLRLIANFGAHSTKERASMRTAFNQPKRLNLHSFLHFRSLSSKSSPNKYEILGVHHGASIKEIKALFKKLTKQYHPDLNTSADEEQKKLNQDRFVEIVSAYDTLKDVKKRKQYDMELRGSPNIKQNNPDRSEWHNKYYGEAKYYLRSEGSHHSMALGLNATRHRVRNFADFENQSHVSGVHVNHGDRHGVPHFDYDNHLSRNLKFEQRLINKHLSPAQRDAIIKQLYRSSNTKVSEELITKHLMRQAHNYANQQSSGRQATYTSTARDPHMYHGPHDSESTLKVATIMTVGAGATYFLYQLWG